MKKSGVSPGQMNSDMWTENVSGREEVIALTTKKVFVEPELVKYEKSLDKVTLNFNCYSTSSGSAGKGS